jgi:hypothetical protein
MGLQQLGLTDVTFPQESFERLVKGGAIATNLVELWHSPPSMFWVVGVKQRDCLRHGAPRDRSKGQPCEFLFHFFD